MFDFDQTLVRPQNHKKFPKDSMDWEDVYKGQVETLRTLHHSLGYHIVICTNQNGVELGHITKEFLLQRFDSYAQYLNVPFLVLAATRKNKFRKPNPGMALYLKQNFMADLSQAFFTGDCAGRLSDRNDDDLLFAQNSGIQFYFPE